MAILAKTITKNFKSLKQPKRMIQASFLVKLAALVTEGFALKEALQFLAAIMPKETYWIETLLKDLERGKPIDQSLRTIGFSERITSQVYLSLVHGQFADTLGMSGHYLAEKSRQEKQLLKLLQYPILLLSFMTGVILIIRMILLPNLILLGIGERRNQTVISFMAISFIEYFPYLVGIFFIIGALTFLSGRFYLRKRTPLKKAEILSSVPYFGKMLKLYYTQYFSYEWSQLFKSGLQLNEIISLMQQKSTTQLMQETAYYLEQSLLEGNHLAESMKELTFFNPEFSLIVLHGEATGHLASELALFSEDCRQRLSEKIEKVFSYIQPLMFLLIAFIILCVYLALLLPMYSLFEEGIL